MGRTEAIAVAGSGIGREKLNNCSIPVDLLPLNARAEAWLKYMDSRQSPVLSECIQVSIPGVLGAGTYYLRISRPDGFIPPRSFRPRHSECLAEWRRSNAAPGELFQHGHSVGRWDGNDLVVVTTNFTFDPDGLDDHLHMASSVQKKVTERYQIIDENTMRLIITLEDRASEKAVHLRSPSFKGVGRSLPRSGERCDADASRREVEFAYPGVRFPEEK